MSTKILWFQYPSATVGIKATKIFNFFASPALAPPDGKTDALLRSRVQPAKAGLPMLRNYSQTVDRVRPTRLQRIAGPQQKDIPDTRLLCRGAP
jgi:hypothetical protein